jgi:DNA (cytosine-5)-methyltransferase 1
MRKLRVLDLFSGIGGFSLGLERAGGFETVAFCEIEEFPRKVLRKHWPKVPIYEDVRTLTADVLAGDGIAVDVITGGFPCQDISVAGRRAGIADGTRSGLWSEIVRLVGELRPRYVIVENVANLLSGPSEQRGGWFGRVLGDLAECGYDAEWENIPASALGAPHRRERIWIIAYPAGKRRPEVALYDIAANVRVAAEWWSSINAGPLVGSCSWADWEKQSGIQLVVDGVPDGSHQCKASGNAVVPQIPELIGRAIMAAQKEEA